MHKEKAAVDQRSGSPKKRRKSGGRNGENVKISYKEKLLGIFLGLDVTTENQYKKLLEKFENAIEIVNGVRSTTILPS